LFGGQAVVFWLALAQEEADEEEQQGQFQSFHGNYVDSMQQK
jgi:hypothetical protein